MHTMIKFVEFYSVSIRNQHTFTSKRISSKIFLISCKRTWLTAVKNWQFSVFLRPRINLIILRIRKTSYSHNILSTTLFYKISKNTSSLFIRLWNCIRIYCDSSLNSTTVITLMHTFLPSFLLLEPFPICTANIKLLYRDNTYLAPKAWEFMH